ncbi:hypothetical protein CBR_g39671 [Chara braunii]|uniref:Uncharacterized protein n=1 Tax=Chara braunii TaxID=69332 RepID=A0A388K1H2_CHABU|nr:hypothetical protein CBR_g39671 [Chara braunii]|eukprot:GBG63890.1 hypothetical protein CBR_g39671 [Chara braunii]
MENTTPPPPQGQQTPPTYEQPLPAYLQLMGGIYHPSLLAPYGLTPVQQQFAPAIHQAPTFYPGQASTSANGQYNQGFGRGIGGNYQPRAFFTREHADFIDKLKIKDAIEEARKRDIEEIARLKYLSRESIRQKEKSRKDGSMKKQGGKDKGKGKEVEERKVDDMKRWVAENFENSLKILTEKLEVVEKKSKLGESEVEELKRLRAEKKLRELRESSSNEKRKRDMAPPGRPRVGRTGKGEKAKDVAKKNEEPDLATGKETGKEDLAPGLYFRDRVVYYYAMHYTEIQSLCKKKGIPYKKKDGGVWELARLDFEVLQKLEEQKEESNTTDNETSEDSSEHESSSESEKDYGQDDIAGI